MSTKLVPRVLIKIVEQDMIAASAQFHSNKIGRISAQVHSRIKILMDLNAKVLNIGKQAPPDTPPAERGHLYFPAPPTFTTCYKG